MALDCDISPFSFWELSVGEVMDLIESKKRKNDRKIKQQATINTVLADQINTGTSIILSEKGSIEPKQIWDYFPGLFAREKKIYEDKQSSEDELERFKENRRAFAMRHNSRYMNGGDI